MPAVIRRMDQNLGPRRDLPDASVALKDKIGFPCTTCGNMMHALAAASLSEALQKWNNWGFQKLRQHNSAYY